MKSAYLNRIVLGWICSEIVPVRFRARLLQRAGVQVQGSLEMYAGASLGSPNIHFSGRIFVNRGLFYDGGAPVYINDQVAIGPKVRLITVTHEIGPSSRRCVSRPIPRAIRIEAGCWIAAGMTVLPGVTVARGCVIAAGAVVAQDTEPDGLYAGVPARRLRDL